jgi:hypothetical protein
VDAAWGPSRFGLSPGGPPNVAQSELSALHTPAEGGDSPHQLLSLENPVAAVALIAGLTVGLIAFSVSGRVGHTTAKIAVGTT